MDLTKQSNVHVLDHPLLKHKISQIRKENTETNEFRALVKEIAVIEGLEAFRGLETKMVRIKTPIEETVQPVIEPSSLCFVPILRAGLGMVDGMLELIPGARVGHIGMYRNEETHEPVEYFCKLPSNIADLEVYLIDPMLATGGSAIDAVAALKKRGVKKISFLCIIAAPEGVEAFVEAYPDVPIFIGALDRELNENAYICPGLGDAGDRIFGTNI
ncbi:MAG: uracil phosphoribosyltransferase [Candidatus Enteromonas sp.]